MSAKSTGLIEQVEQKRSWLAITDCDSAGQSAPAAHCDAFALGDEFAAAFESRRVEFELCDDVTRLVLIQLGDEGSIRDPHKKFGSLQPDAREFLESVVAQSIHSHWLVSFVGHRHERVAVTRRGERRVLFR